ncbi:MAG: RAQPRD family integrative conjugative element protein [Haemophilus parainfluenzae]|nr:RAQPRD family integrative conjugative element protein [Haemophilus parainfluenzae]
MTKNIFSLSLTIGLLFGAISAQATEQEHLAQAIKQLDAAKLSLQRAAASAKVSAKSREYFDYASAYQDIATVQAGIKQYINPSRAIPRNPKAIRNLKEDYLNLRSQ